MISAAFPACWQSTRIDRCPPTLAASATSGFRRWQRRPRADSDAGSVGHEQIPTLVDVVPAALIGAGSVSTAPGRPSSLQAGFGLMLTLAFATIISALRAGGSPEPLLHTLLLGSSAVWMFRQSGVKSLACLTIVAVILLADGWAAWRARHEHPLLDAEQVVRSVETFLWVLAAGWLEFVVGFVRVKFAERGPANRGEEASSGRRSRSGEPRKKRRPGLMKSPTVRRLLMSSKRADPVSPLPRNRGPASSAVLITSLQACISSLHFFVPHFSVGPPAYGKRRQKNGGTEGCKERGLYFGDRAPPGGTPSVVQQIRKN